MEAETITALGGSGGVIAMLGLLVKSLRDQVSDGRTSLEKANAALDKERESCTERIEKLETRLDEERNDCEERHERMAARLDKMEDRVRRMTPQAFPKVTP